jgi:molybdenum cofactor cytidylyltransferase
MTIKIKRTIIIFLLFEHKRVYTVFMISCVLLTAGLSERFGSPKALASLHNAIIIEHLQKTLLQTSCAEIIIVLGAYAQEIKAHLFNHKRINIVYNKDYKLGQTSSMQTGLRKASSNTHGYMLLPVDCPLIEVSTIEQIIDHFHHTQPHILIPTYQNKKGHPPIFHKNIRTDILNVPPSQGLNSLFTSFPPKTIEIKDPGIIRSFNTPQEFEQIKKDA